MVNINITTMTKEEKKKYLEAVDSVCIRCIMCEESVCETCPVRKSVDYYNKQYDYDK